MNGWGGKEPSPVGIYIVQAPQCVGLRMSHRSVVVHGARGMHVVAMVACVHIVRYRICVPVGRVSAGGAIRCIVWMRRMYLSRSAVHRYPSALHAVVIMLHVAS